MRLFDNAFKEILSAQVISLIGGLIAGTILASYLDKILLVPGIFLILPGLLEMRGNISATLASRLSSGLFLRVIKPAKPDIKIMNGNITASFILVIFVSLALGLIAFAFNLIVFHTTTPKIILLALLTGLIANIIEIPLTIKTTLYLFKKGHDPNNIMGPFITSTGDIITTLSLLIALAIV